ncbi:MAG TPA: UDP-N-acetylmuramoyl-L-alanyl-D-glutamate--2,6-diaminopimelate ligase [Acidimicrobiia bacterium]|nr:UDP-N-acetylmuramoyl-L-alanyl-D-glutamate--2,6-diaminopimelate ligase [Acidimicrobiia bacterium]
MLLHELLDSVDVLELRGDPRTEIASVTHDSRAVGPGDLFCCVVGSAADGHDHAPAAVAAGAAALLVERPLGLPVAEVRVASVRAAMGPLAAAAWGHPSTKLAVLGVTGTNGKTTTTWLLENIARAAGITPGVIGTIGTRIAGAAVPGERTTPEATELQALLARMVDAGVGLAAIEVSSHALVMGRVDGTRFAAACFTNLSHDHLDFHAGLDEYFEAKALLFEPARTDSAAANLDDPHGAEIARRAEAAGLAVLGFGLDSPGAAVRAEGLLAGGDGNRFRLVTPYGAADVRSPLVGRFNASNALAAAATALAAGLDVDSVAAGLSAPLVVPGRMERVEAGQPFPVVVDYAHTPDGLEQVLRAARPLAGSSGRVVLVFGCGGDRDRAKRPEMGRTAAALADVVIVTSDNPRSEDPAAIIGEVLTGIPAGVEPVVIADRRAAIAAALADRRPEDVVIVAGKGHEQGQTAGGVTVPFDDRTVAREELARLGWPAHGTAGQGTAACA